MLFRHSIRENEVIIQPPLDFEVGVKTVAGLMCLGYRLDALVESSVVRFSNDKLEVSLEDIYPLQQVSPLPLQYRTQECVRACVRVCMRACMCVKSFVLFGSDTHLILPSLPILLLFLSVRVCAVCLSLSLTPSLSSSPRFSVCVRVCVCSVTSRSAAGTRSSCSALRLSSG